MVNLSLCRGAFFIPRLRALPGRESRMPAEVAAIRPAVAGTRGMNPSWEETGTTRSGDGECEDKAACQFTHMLLPDDLFLPNSDSCPAFRRLQGEQPRPPSAYPTRGPEEHTGAG
jgi:hypothetical protein